MLNNIQHSYYLIVYQRVYINVKFKLAIECHEELH